MRTALLLAVSFTMLQLNAQQKIFIGFTNKRIENFDPYSYFDAKVINKRLDSGLPLYDFYDLPINQQHKDAVLSCQDIRYVNESRWLNGLIVYASQQSISHIRALPCVRTVYPLSTSPILSITNYDTTLNESLDSLLIRQTEEFEPIYFYNHNINGAGITIAVFDAGFPNADKSPALKHLFDNEQIIATYDFVRNKEFVYSYNAHGTMVLSCIAGNIKGKNMGLAQGASFLLARTETFTEPLSEEENWLAAVEWAHRHGANIINSSLGYIHQRYFNSDMDGTTSLVAQAARIAARKGMLVVNAMGNSGGDRWHFMGTPADVDSVLSIAGIDPATGIHINFSSYGPTARYQRKPNVAAFGEAVVADKKKIKKSQGTSFSTPLIAGYAACVWQMNPNKSNMEIFSLIEQSGQLYPYFDYAHGYGIPKASYFFHKHEMKENLFTIEQTPQNIIVQINDSALTTANNKLYWHIENTSGYLRKSQVIRVDTNKPLILSNDEINQHETIRVHYNGQTKELAF